VPGKRKVKRLNTVTGEWTPWLLSVLPGFLPLSMRRGLVRCSPRAVSGGSGFELDRGPALACRSNGMVGTTENLTWRHWRLHRPICGFQVEKDERAGDRSAEREGHVSVLHDVETVVSACRVKCVHPPALQLSHHASTLPDLTMRS
jgi:hypothetical protein